MKWTLTIIMVVCILLSGCTAVLDDGETPDSTDEAFNGSSNFTRTSTATPSENESEAGHNYVEHGEGFAALVQHVLDQHRHTDYISSTSHPNRTVDLTIQVRDRSPLYRTMMDGAQAVAAVTFYGTSANESLPKENGSIQRFHQPDLVRIDILGPSGDYLGTYEIDPKRAREYRLTRRSPEEFANDVISSYESEEFYDRGSSKPSDYLNRSELSLWARDYATEVRNWSQDSFDSEFPVNDIRMNSRTNEILHEFEWSMNEYGQVTDSAYATVYTSYWRTVGRSWAKAPQNLYVYIDRPNHDKNYASYMNRQDVYILLESNLDPVNRSTYLHQAEGGFVETNGNPYRDKFYSSANATGD